ncbi:MAG: hypothetical protein ACI81L_002301 [Verrucomicrobiales bacterium]|jgi:hypothetical protein
MDSPDVRNGQSRFPRWLLGLVVIGTIAFGFFSFKEDQGALFVGVLTVGVTAYGISRQQENDRQARQDEERREREARRDEERRTNKIDAYAAILNTWFDALLGSTKQKEAAMKRLQSDSLEQLKKIIPWASDGVIRSFSRLRTAQSTGDNPLAAFGELLLAIRKDLGHENDGVTDYELATLYVIDLTKDKWDELTSSSEITAAEG